MERDLREHLPRNDWLWKLPQEEFEGASQSMHTFNGRQDLKVALRSERGIGRDGGDGERGQDLVYLLLDHLHITVSPTDSIEAIGCDERRPEIKRIGSVEEKMLLACG